jgi:exopolysaccharide biosynthesis polyprenyl glycosylphosphotransferase
MHTAAMYFPVLLGGRLAFRGVSNLEVSAQRVLVIGTSELGVAIARAMAKSGSLGAQLVGFLSDDVLDELAIIAGVPVLGKIHELAKQVDAHRIDTIVVATRNRSDHFPAPELLIGKFRGLRIESGVSFYERISGRVWIRDLRPSYLIFSNGFRVCRFSAAVKRLIDIGLSTVGLVIAAPIILLSVIAIRLDSKGSGFYRQERVGKDGEMFTLLKLRSMCTDAEKKSGPVWTRNHDDRVTRVGKYLRMTRVDELPQLWNVLKNDMTLVGPRPERPEFVEKLSERYPYFALRATFKPGITGWAQIWKGYVNEVGEFEEKLALDLYYMKYRSTMMDLRIMWKTAETVLLMRGV